MMIFKKLFAAVIGLFLMIFNHKTFSISALRGKRIAIIGPASSALGTHLGSFIDQYDIVVRLNKSPFQVRKNLHAEHIGQRTDILCHSYLENSKNGGGSLNFQLYKELGITHVINPIPTRFGKRLVFNYYKKYLKAQTTYSAPKVPYTEVIEHFEGFRPTTGFGTLLMLMAADFEELYISGFTFFKTPYAQGYRDHYAGKDAVEKMLIDQNQHNPDIEYQQFQELLKKNSHKKILVDKELQAILKRDGVEVKTIDYTP